MRSTRRKIRRGTGYEGSFWLSFSDLMSSLLLIFILIMFYIMYESFDMYEINMAQIAQQQYDLDQANASMTEQQTKLTEQEKQMIAQQIKLDAAQKDLEDAQAILASQQADLEQAKTDLATTQAALDEKQAEVDAQQTALDSLNIELQEKQTQIETQQASLTAQQTTLDEQKATLTAQQTTIDSQQQALDNQQAQLEELVGLKTRLITSLSDVMRQSGINASVDSATGAITLESQVLYAYGKNELTYSGQRFIDEFLPVYLSVLFSDEYLPSLAEIIIEGHTDRAGGYVYNLELSQQRALSVATYILSDEYDGITSEQKELLKTKITVNGKSYSDPIYDENGEVDDEASRRVVFKFRLTDDQMIEQMRGILEAQDVPVPETAE